VRISDDEERLLEALRQELRLDAFRGGFHDDRGDRRWKEDGVRMVRGWAAVIAPSFDPWTAVAVIDTGAGRRFGAALGTEPREPLGVVELVASEAFDLPANWADPVPEALRSVNLYESGDYDFGWVDGVGYRLFVETPLAEVSFDFSNPTTSDLQGLETALYAAVASAAEHAEHDRLRRFARRYTTRG
jgi:hypothetical protein